MPDAPAQVAAPAPEAGVALPAVPVKERGAALIAKHVAKHEKALAEDAAKELGEAEPAPKGPRARGPNGAFLPAGAKPKRSA